MPLLRITGRRLALAAAINTAASTTAFWALEQTARGGQYSVLDAIYWAGITAPTVGYGDVLPTLAVTKIVTLWLVLTSWAAFGIAISLMSAWLIEDPFEAEVNDDNDDQITMLCMLLENAGLEVPSTVEEWHGTPTHYTPES